jgi:hypothetical protein
MTRILAGTIAIVAVLGTGVVHGLWTDRWKVGEAPAAAAARLTKVSFTLDDWEGEPLDAAPTLGDALAGHLYRRYVNRQSGQSVVVAVFCGRPGPIAVHTPDVCYAGGGYDVGTPVRHTVSPGAQTPPAELKTAQLFKTRSSDRSQLRIFWSWSADGNWTAPDNPRFTFARRPFLYKLYVIRETSSGGQSLDSEPCLELLQLLLPELQRCLFASS